MNLDISADSSEKTDLDCKGQHASRLESHPGEMLRIEELTTAEAQVLDPVNGILAVPTQSNDIQIVDVNSGELMAKLTGHDSIITSIAFDAPGPCTADEDGRLHYGRSNLSRPIQVKHVCSVDQRHDIRHEGSARHHGVKRRIHPVLRMSREGTEQTDLQATDVNRGSENPAFSGRPSGLSVMDDGSVRVW